MSISRPNLSASGGSNNKLNAPLFTASPSPPMAEGIQGKVDTEAEALFVLTNKFGLFDTARKGIRDELASWEDIMTIVDANEGLYTQDVKDAAKFITDNKELYQKLAGEDDMISLGEASAASAANPVGLVTQPPSSPSEQDFSYANALGTLKNKFNLFDVADASGTKDTLVGWSDLMAIRESGQGVYPEDVVKTATLLTDNNGEYFSRLAGDDGLFTIENIESELKSVQQETDSLPNGAVNPFSQGALGDCWVVASVNAIANDANGKEIIKNSITNNPDGTYSVQFKGAPDKVYTVTQEMLKNNKNSSGDLETAILEEAARQYYSETQNGRDIGKGGRLTEMTGLLTGQTTTRISSAEELRSLVEKDQDGLSLVFGSKPGKDGTAETSAWGHAYTVTSIDYATNTVYYTNPWDSGRVRTMSIETLLNSAEIEAIEPAA